ncbi:hypothetical protein ACHAXR_000535, partial [Thalassiosira sp. AJA248-18]
MRNKHRKRISQLLKKKQRRLEDYLNLVLVLSYCSSKKGGDDDEELKLMEDNSDDNDVEEERERLCYYQGFHDVGSIILSALGGASSSHSSSSLLPGNNDDKHAQQQPHTNNTNSSKKKYIMATASAMNLTLPTRVLLRLTQTHLHDATKSNFHSLQSALQLIILPLTASFDPQLHSHLINCQITEPYFCLSWVITWFSHDVRDTELVKRLYDFFIVSHPLMSVYMSVAMMIHPLNRIEVLGVDCGDFAGVHVALADLPKNSSCVGWRYLG